MPSSELISFTSSRMRVDVDIVFTRVMGLGMDSALFISTLVLRFATVTGERDLVFPIVGALFSSSSSYGEFVPVNTYQYVICFL